MIPVPAATLRILPPYSSATKTFPAPSTARPAGLSRAAWVAGPPSPRDEPPPAKVEMTPVEALTRRTRPFPVAT